MKNQDRFIYLSTNELQDLIQFLKDYSNITGQAYKYAKDIKSQQEIATMNFDLNKLIKKLQNEFERK